MYFKTEKIVKRGRGFFRTWHWICRCVSAVALGAKLVEKHVTLSRKMLGPDHAASLGFMNFQIW